VTRRVQGSGFQKLKRAPDVLNMISCPAPSIARLRRGTSSSR